MNFNRTLQKINLVSYLMLYIKRTYILALAICEPTTIREIFIENHYTKELVSSMFKIKTLFHGKQVAIDYKVVSKRSSLSTSKLSSSDGFPVEH